jgi:hypothetical protein
MHASRPTAATRSSLSFRPVFLTLALLATALAILATRADAAANICTTTSGSCAPSKDLDRTLSDLQMSHANGNGIERDVLSDQEFYSFSGVGVIACTVSGRQQTSTAFLVGAFDIGVTVGHTFEENGQWVDPTKCVYTSVDSLGQIRERIPVLYIKAQWETEVGAFGQPAKDLAVVRLAAPSRYAQRTMPLGKFSGAAAPVYMVGFKTDIDSDTMKRKARGTVYERDATGIARSTLAGFAHDIESRGIAAGAPVIDERSGVIIGIHMGLAARHNTMIAMNEWLEQTLRGEMEASAPAPSAQTSSVEAH